MAGVGAGVGVGVRGGGAVGSLMAWPQESQKRADGLSWAPQLGQTGARGAPHASQNDAPSRFSWPQDGQITVPHRPFRMRIRQWCVKTAALSNVAGFEGACARLITCLKSTGSSAGDQCRRTARIVNQDVLVRRGLRAMPSRLRRSESRPPGVHWELLMQVPRVAGDSQRLVDWCHSCSRECARLLPER
jgi:hypothetical protein